jgi:diguanylate cyclase (GGDEF)-like protein
MSGSIRFDEPFGDARVEELRLLTLAAHGRPVIDSSSVPDGPWRDLFVWLVRSDFLEMFTYEWAKNYFGEGSLGDDSVVPGQSKLEKSRAISRNLATLNIYEHKSMELHLTHSGRIRLSELKQALRSGREREPFGILWDVRHWEQDLQIALLDASDATPVALVYLDMNGLKQINDTHGHDAGDLALKAYFQAVASVVGDSGQAYRLSGGADEVLVLFPNSDVKTAVQLVRIACSKLMSERLWPLDPDALLSMAAGIVVCTDSAIPPIKLRSDADTEQKRAKLRSKETKPRPSVIASRGDSTLLVVEHQLSVFPISVSGSYFSHITKGEGIGFTVVNNGPEEFPPYKIALFHPKLGSYLIFPSEKKGPLLSGQQRKHECPLDVKQAWFPKFSHGGNGELLDASDDREFELRLVLEDSDNKVLFANKRIARGFVAIVRRSIQSGGVLGGNGELWRELSSKLPDEFASEENRHR